jgi:hypothetical protein
MQNPCCRNSKVPLFKNFPPPDQFPKIVMIRFGEWIALSGLDTQHTMMRQSLNSAGVESWCQNYSTFPSRSLLSYSDIRNSPVFLVYVCAVLFLCGKNEF